MPEDKWWGHDTVAVVTGANKGIGFEIARLLAEAGMTVVLTSRDEARGMEALAKLENLAEATPGTTLEYHQLDISDAKSVQAFATWLAAQHQALHILVNNAGIAYKGNTFGADEAATTLATNYKGTAAVCEALLPMLRAARPPARIVNVSSSAGSLRILPSAALRARFESPSSKGDLDGLADQFVADIRAGQHRERGWPSSMYGVSKALETAYTRLLAEQLRGDGISVNACCPGYCATDMSSWGGTQTAAQGADTPVWLALMPPAQFVTGGFYRDRRQQSF